MNFLRAAALVLSVSRQPPLFAEHVAEPEDAPHTLAPQDRHNGNILVDSRGRMVHLGFSYVLGWAPGGMTFEKSAFKLTRDVVDVWGGRGSPIYDEFTNVMVQVSLAYWLASLLLLISLLEP